MALIPTATCAASVEQQGWEGGGDASRVKEEARCCTAPRGAMSGHVIVWKVHSCAQRLGRSCTCLCTTGHNEVLYKHPRDVPHLAVSLVGKDRGGLNIQEERLKGTAGSKLCVAQENAKLTSPPSTFGI